MIYDMNVQRMKITQSIFQHCHNCKDTCLLSRANRYFKLTFKRNNADDDDDDDNKVVLNESKFARLN
jgi:hypothetical protein